MPIVTIQLSPKTYAAIARLVEAGTYESARDFIELATANQLVREVEGGDHESPAISGVQSNPWAAFRETHAPNLALASPPSVFEGRIWGQVNRILPLKAVLRFLLTAHSEHTSWQSFSALRDDLGHALAQLGDRLAELDRKTGRQRELWATSFPRTDRPASVERFLSQFVARETVTAVQEGALIQFGLAALQRDAVIPTRAGLNFASAPNVVLDSNGADVGSPRQLLSTDEQKLFLSHVRTAAPLEYSDYVTTTAAVSAGKTSPDELTSHIGTVVNILDWTPVMVRTYASGLLSRMVDLGLLARAWKGRNVEYSVTAANQLKGQAVLGKKVDR